VAADLARRADPACEGVGPVPELDPGEDGGGAVRLREAILLDDNGLVCEGSGENIFVLREGELVTPGHTSSILDGISRRSIIQIAEDLGYKVVERDIARAELYLAEEIFLCGTAAELVPVREVDGHELGNPGEVTRLIQAKFEDALHGRAPEYAEWLDLVRIPSKVTG
jgi:branched-chain amino acid aminotransferase